MKPLRAAGYLCFLLAIADAAATRSGYSITGTPYTPVVLVVIGWVLLRTHAADQERARRGAE